MAETDENARPLEENGIVCTWLCDKTLHSVYSETPLHVTLSQRNQLYTSLMQAMKPQQQQSKQKDSNVAASEVLLGAQQQQKEYPPINLSQHAALWPRLLQALGNDQGEGTSVYAFCRETLPTSSLVLAATANGRHT